MNSITNAFAKLQDNTIRGLVLKQPKFKEGWSFSGSYKTYQALKAQGKIS